MNMFARFDENQAKTLEVIKKTKRSGRTDARTDNVKTVYPTTNKVCGGYNKKKSFSGPPSSVSNAQMPLICLFFRKDLNKQEMSQTRDECPQRNWSSIRHI